MNIGIERRKQDEIEWKFNETEGRCDENEWETYDMYHPYLNTCRNM